eukprot:758107-Prorocentrum_lima.AAC.1
MSNKVWADGAPLLRNGSPAPRLLTSPQAPTTSNQPTNQLTWPKQPHIPQNPDLVGPVRGRWGRR